MATKKSKKSRSKKEKQPRASMMRHRITDKDAAELLKDDSQLTQMYKAVKSFGDEGGSMRDIKSKLQSTLSAADWGRLKTRCYDTIAALRKENFVKSAKLKAAAKAAAAAA